ncbi:ATP-binding cassette domain-containing protein [Dactylosporangium roseum]|uniref:ATP-binding cassette domain-containing protein n=1 Tax=Dactylosporangium roseum TaxID=47989 RepID=UPI0021B392F5
MPPGRIVALLGANGAGNTTLLRALSGLLDVHDGALTKGAVALGDRPIHRLRPAAIVRRGVSRVMEGRPTFADSRTRPPSPTSSPGPATRTAAPTPPPIPVDHALVVPDKPGHRGSVEAPQLHDQRSGWGVAM